MLQVTADRDLKIRFLGNDLQRFPTHFVSIATIAGPKVHDFTQVKVEGHLPPFRPMNNPANVLLDDFATGRSESLSRHFGVISNLRYGGF